MTTKLSLSERLDRLEVRASVEFDRAIEQLRDAARGPDPREAARARRMLQVIDGDEKPEPAAAKGVSYLSPEASEMDRTMGLAPGLARRAPAPKRSALSPDAAAMDRAMNISPADGGVRREGASMVFGVMPARVAGEKGEA